MTSMPHLATIDWDHADRMQHCDLGGGGDVWFVYDGAGNRVRKVQVNQSGTTVTERIYLGGLELYRQTVSGTLDSERQSVHVADDTGRMCLVETLTVDGGSAVGSPVSVQRFQFANHLGTALLEVDGTGAVISYEEFHPYGTASYGGELGDRGQREAVSVHREGAGRGDGAGPLGARYTRGGWGGGRRPTDGLGDGVNRYAYSRGDPVRLDPGGNAAELLVEMRSEYADTEKKPLIGASIHVEASVDLPIFGRVGVSLHHGTGTLAPQTKTPRRKGYSTGAPAEPGGATRREGNSILNPGAGGPGLHRAAPKGPTLKLPDSYDATKMRAYRKGVAARKLARMRDRDIPRPVVAIAPNSGPHAPSSRPRIQDQLSRRLGGEVGTRTILWNSNTISPEGREPASRTTVGRMRLRIRQRGVGATICSGTCHGGTCRWCRPSERGRPLA